MTALLSCDGCGAIVSERPDDADPTAEWWVLSRGPTVGGGGAGMLSMLATVQELDEDQPEPEFESFEVPDPEPDRHFCCDDCASAWFARRRENP